MIKNFFSLMTLMLLLASCANDVDNVNRFGLRGGQDIQFFASIEDGSDPQTKVFADSKMRVLWNANDQISIFNFKTDNMAFQFAGEDGDNAGGFAFVSGSLSGADIDHIYAVYPYAETTAVNQDGELTLSLPAAQTYKENSFGIGANTMVSVSDDTHLRFKNVGGYLSLKFYGEGVSVKSITLRSNSHEKLAGPAKVSMTVGGTPTTEMQEGATESVTLTCETPVALGADAEHFTEFWFVLPPTTLATGFTVTVTDALGGVFEMASVKERTITRNKLIRLSPMEVKPIYNLVPPDNEIWYTTTDNNIINLEASSYHQYNPKPFDSNVIAHTYENGKGIIKCDVPITTINKYVFSNSGNKLGFISHLFLPNSITDLNEGALQDLGTRELRIPNSLKYVGEYALQSPSFERFLGDQVSEDGRLVIIDEGFAPDYGDKRKPVKGYVAAFAPFNISTYALPDYVKELGWDVFFNVSLKEIVLNEGLEVIDGGCFYGSTLDCSIRIPNSLVSLDPYAFMGCSGIKKFYGNNRFHTEDGHCLVYYRGEEKWINLYVGEDEDYSIPEGIVAIENYTFNRNNNLKTVTLPSTLNNIGSVAFNECENLKALYGDCVSEDHRAVVFGDVFFRLFITKGIKTYTIPNGYKSLGYEAFAHLSDLEEIVLPDSIVELGAYDFAWCNNLKKVVLSANLTGVGGNGGNPFQDCWKLEEIYFRSYNPPAFFGDLSVNFDFQSSTLSVYVPEETLDLYKSSGWYQFASYMKGYKYDDIGEWNPDYYMSTDYSADGQIATLQTATVGTGIDLILMGDAFSDRQIADGTYASVMQKAMNAFFSEEPYKTMKNCFNVYQVNVVSATEGYEHAGQALATGHGDGTFVFGNDSKVIEYAHAVVGDTRMDDALVIVMMNEDAYAGTCFMYYPDSGDYSRGLSIAYFPASSDTDTFNGLVSHEAGGHGFAKLADEYAYEYMGAISANDIANAKAMEPYGWWKNVDFTSDPAQVKWNHFIADDRYDGQGLGCFEGGFTYWSGVWRPTENSIMRYNTGGFNAPSREAIWYRIHKLAYGENWQYNYEDFVAYDAVNRAAAASYQAPRPDYVTRQLPKPTPPVVIGHSWREELDRK